MNRRFSAVVALVLAACATYTGTKEVVDGDLDGRCFPNGTCNVGLRCAADKCVIDASPRLDASTSDDTGVTTGQDAAADGALSGDASDASKPLPCDVTPSSAPDGVVECVDSSCVNGGDCCGTNHQCTQNCTNVQVNLPCDGPEDCMGGGATRCCGNLGTKVIDTVMCPRSGVFTKLVSRCAASCSPDEVELCTEQKCANPAQRCTRLLASFGGGGTNAFNVGYCE